MFRKAIVSIMVLVMAVTFMPFMEPANAVTKTELKGDRLAKYTLKNYKLVQNPKWNFQKKRKYRWWEYFSASVGKILSYDSTKGVSVKMTRWLRVDFDNPQSIAVTPDGKYMFIMTVPKGQKGVKENMRKGCIWKIQLKAMQKDPYVKKLIKEDGYIHVEAEGMREPDPPRYDWINKDGKAFYDASEEQWLEDSEKGKLDYDDKSKLYNHSESDKGFDKWAKSKGFEKKENIYDSDYVYRKYFSHSKEMVCGHGQTMAYNPKTKKLWYLPNMKKKQCRAVMVDPDTLKQEAVVDFKLKSTVKCPSTLTFDKRGNAYCYARTKKKKNGIPASVAKVYKGTLSPKNVKFNLVMAGVRWTPGTTPQSLGYNPKSDRLYLVSDSSIVTLPVKKILNTNSPSLKASDIKCAQWKFSREFEGISFDKKGNGYFLTNKPDEVMLVSKGF